MTPKGQALGYLQRPQPAPSVLTYRQPDLSLHQLLLLFPSFWLQTTIEDNDCAPILDLRNRRDRVSASIS